MGAHMYRRRQTLRQQVTPILIGIVGAVDRDQKGE